MAAEKRKLTAKEITQMNKEYTFFSWSVQGQINPIPVARAEGVYFWDADGKRYTAMQVQRAFKDALSKAEIEDFRFHDLRHCFASWNRQAGIDLDTLADLMGHKDTRMTRRYAHIGPQHLATAISQLEKSYRNFGTISEQSKEKELRQSP